MKISTCVFTSVIGLVVLCAITALGSAYYVGAFPSLLGFAYYDGAFPSLVDVPSYVLLYTLRHAYAAFWPVRHYLMGIVGRCTIFLTLPVVCFVLMNGYFVVLAIRIVKRMRFRSALRTQIDRIRLTEIFTAAVFPRTLSIARDSQTVRSFHDAADVSNTLNVYLSNDNDLRRFGELITMLVLVWVLGNPTLYAIFIVLDFGYYQFDFGGNTELVTLINDATRLAGAVPFRRSTLPGDQIGAPIPATSYNAVPPPPVAPLQSVENPHRNSPQTSLEAAASFGEFRPLAICLSCGSKSNLDFVNGRWCCPRHRDLESLSDSFVSHLLSVIVKWLTRNRDPFGDPVEEDVVDEPAVEPEVQPTAPPITPVQTPPPSPVPKPLPDLESIVAAVLAKLKPSKEPPQPVELSQSVMTQPTQPIPQPATPNLESIVGLVLARLRNGYVSNPVTDITPEETVVISDGTRTVLNKLGFSTGTVLLRRPVRVTYCDGKVAVPDYVVQKLLDGAPHSLTLMDENLYRAVRESCITCSQGKHDFDQALNMYLTMCDSFEEMVNWIDSEMHGNVSRCVKLMYLDTLWSITDVREDKGKNKRKRDLWRDHVNYDPDALQTVSDVLRDKAIWDDRFDELHLSKKAMRAIKGIHNVADVTVRNYNDARQALLNLPNDAPRWQRRQAIAGYGLARNDLVRFYDNNQSALTSIAFGGGPLDADTAQFLQVAYMANTAEKTSDDYDWSVSETGFSWSDAIDEVYGEQPPDFLTEGVYSEYESIQGSVSIHKPLPAVPSRTRAPTPPPKPAVMVPEVAKTVKFEAADPNFPSFPLFDSTVVMMYHGQPVCNGVQLTCGLVTVSHSEVDSCRYRNVVYDLSKIARRRVSDDLDLVLIPTIIPSVPVAKLSSLATPTIGMRVSLTDYISRRSTTGIVRDVRDITADVDYETQQGTCGAALIDVSGHMVGIHYADHAFVPFTSQVLKFFREQGGASRLESRSTKATHSPLKKGPKSDTRLGSRKPSREQPVRPAKQAATDDKVSTKSSSSPKRSRSLDRV